MGWNITGLFRYGNGREAVSYFAALKIPSHERFKFGTVWDADGKWKEAKISKYAPNGDDLFPHPNSGKEAFPKIVENPDACSWLSNPSVPDIFFKKRKIGKRQSSSLYPPLLCSGLIPFFSFPTLTAKWLIIKRVIVQLNQYKEKMMIELSLFWNKSGGKRKKKRV